MYLIAKVSGNKPIQRKAHITVLQTNLSNCEHRIIKIFKKINFIHCDVKKFAVINEGWLKCLMEQLHFNQKSGNILKIITKNTSADFHKVQFKMKLKNRPVLLKFDRRTPKNNLLFKKNI